MKESEKEKTIMDMERVLFDDGIIHVFEKIMGYLDADELHAFGTAYPFVEEKIINFLMRKNNDLSALKERYTAHQMRAGPPNPTGKYLWFPPTKKFRSMTRIQSGYIMRVHFELHLYDKSMDFICSRDIGKKAKLVVLRDQIHTVLGSEVQFLDSATLGTVATQKGGNLHIFEYQGKPWFYKVTWRCFKPPDFCIDRLDNTGGAHLVWQGKTTCCEKPHSRGVSLAVSDPFVCVACNACLMVTMYKQAQVVITFQLKKTIHQRFFMQVSKGLFLAYRGGHGVVMDPKCGTKISIPTPEQSWATFAANKTYALIQVYHEISIMDRNQGCHIRKIPFPHGQIQRVIFNKNMLGLVGKAMEGQRERPYKSVDILTGETFNYVAECDPDQAMLEADDDHPGFANVPPRWDRHQRCMLQEYGFPKMPKDRELLQRFLFPTRPADFKSNKSAFFT